MGHIFVEILGHKNGTTNLRRFLMNLCVVLLAFGFRPIGNLDVLSDTHFHLLFPRVLIREGGIFSS